MCSCKSVGCWIDRVRAPVVFLASTLEVTHPSTCISTVSKQPSTMHRLRTFVAPSRNSGPVRSTVLLSTYICPPCSSKGAFRLLSRHFRGSRQSLINYQHRFAPMSTMVSATQIKDVFDSSVFQKIRKLWFQDVANDEELILPTTDLAKQWFTSDPTFDKLCRYVLISSYSRSTLTS